MYHKNTFFQITARTLLALFLANTVAPTLQFAFADSTQYYVDATGGNDANDGLTPATAWQTLAQVSSTPLLQGDTVSLLCSESWAETLNLTAAPGSAGLPITINSYGSCPTETPTIEGLNISGSTYVLVNGIDISNSAPGNIVNVDSSYNVTVQNSTISGNNATCVMVQSSSGVAIDRNSITVCQDGVTFSGASEGYASDNTLSAILNEGIHVSSADPVEVSYNTFLNVGESAILYGSDTDVLRNNISTVCTTGSSECAAVRNSPQISGATTSTVVENSIEDIGTGDDALSNAGILASGVSGVSIIKNGVQNAQYAVRLVDTSNTNISQNTLLFSRINALSVVQYTPGATSGNAFTGNTFLQRAPDYPYIELRDEVPGNGIVTGFMTFDANNILPNYKPNTSYVRTVKFGGETVEYSKAELNLLDANITKFEYFGYKPYINTGSFATANLLTNGNLDVDATNWTPAALTGSAPVISHNGAGSYSGGSATVTPAGGAPDRIWITNDAVMSITAAQTFLVTGYAKSSSGNINLRAFLHASGDPTNIYSDRIAETYASSTGGTFAFYITATTTAADAQLSFETSNNDVAYEIDEVSFRRLAAHVKNTNTYEVLAYSNPTGFDAFQSCPGGAQCFAYVDRINATSGWDITIPAYSTSFVLWNNSPNIINTPVCTINLSSGSVPTGQPVDASWVATGSFTHTFNYETYTGVITESVGRTGSRTFIPPYDAVTTISMDLINDIGPNTCSVQVTTTNTAPNIFPVTITGSEDATQIDGTLSGVDLNPGDTVFFEKFADPTYGVLNVDSSGSIQYFPFADVCGTDSFLFRATDQYRHYADYITQNIQIECSNDAPFAVDDSANTNGPMVSVDVLTNDTDIDSPYVAQTFSIASFTQPMSGSVVQNGDNLEYTPIGSFSGADTFLYRMVDQSGALSTNTGTVTIHVTLPNMAPDAFNMNLTVNEDDVLSDVLSGSDINGDILTFTALTLPLSGALSLLPNGTFSYTPDSNIYGSDTFDFMASDGAFDSNTGTVTITITSVPDAPIGVDDSYSLNQDTFISVPVLTNDSDVDSLTYFITGVTNPANGTVVLSGASIDYIPNTGYFGSDSFTYQVEDDTGLLSNVVTVNMNVVFMNATPTANSASASVNEDTTLNGVVTGSDPEMSTLTYILDSTTTNGALTLSSTGGYRYIPNANFHGSDSFSFHVSDGLLSSTSATIDITVNPINDIPTANTLTLTAVGNSVVSSGNVSTGVLTANDIDGDSLTFALVTAPTHGLLTLSSTGYLSYTPALGYIGSDSFVYRVNDGTVNSTNTTVNINVTDNGIPIPLGYFTLSAPSSVYTGSSFSITIQARNLAGNIMTNYTGTVSFTSSDSLATLPSSTTFAPTDLGVKTLSNSTTFLTLGTQTLRVEDMPLTASGIATISVVVPAITQSVTGPGGGFSSAPGSGLIPSGSGNGIYYYGGVPSVDNNTQFYFVGEGAELLNKLMLVNRVYQGEGIFTRNGTQSVVDGTPTTTLPGEIPSSDDFERNTPLMNLTEEELVDSTSTLSLRLYFWDHLYRAERSSDPDALYDDARMKLEGMYFEDNDRLHLVREVLLRILDSQQRKYREIIDRDVAVYSPSRNEEDENSDSLDNLDSTDLSEIDLSELELTDEELALLLGE